MSGHHQSYYNSKDNFMVALEEKSRNPPNALIYTIWGMSVP